MGHGLASRQTPSQRGVRSPCRKEVAPSGCEMAGAPPFTNEVPHQRRDFAWELVKNADSQTPAQTYRARLGVEGGSGLCVHLLSR